MLTSAVAYKAGRAIEEAKKIKTPPIFIGSINTIINDIQNSVDKSLQLYEDCKDLLCRFHKEDRTASLGEFEINNYCLSQNVKHLRSFSKILLFKTNLFVEEGKILPNIFNK